MLYITKDLIGLFMWSGLFQTTVLGFDLSMVINTIAYFLAGATVLWVWMDATPTGRKVKTSLPFIRTNY